MSNELRNVAASIADKLFLPVDIEYKNYFTLPLRVLVLVFFIYSGIIATPPVIDWVKTNSFPLPWIDSVIEKPIFWKIWLPYINFVLELFFFLMIGGSVFSEWLVAHSKKTIDRYEAAMELAKKKDIQVAKDELAKEMEKYYSLLNEINYP